MFLHNDHPRLGRIQSAIMAMLFHKEMYGLEIKNHLKLKGLSIGPGQLYPTLNRLEENKMLSSRIEQRVGANRKFYKLTEHGKNCILQYALDFFSLFFDLFLEPLYSYIIDDLTEFIKLTPGMVVLDFSSIHFEQVINQFARLTAPTGRYLLVSHEKADTNILNDRISYYNLENTVMVLEKEENKKNKISIPDQSVDFALVLFTIHEDENEWIVSEMARVLKPSGQGVIIDIEPIKDHFLFDLMIKFAPNHSAFGSYLHKLEDLLDKNKLKIKNHRSSHGIVYYSVLPKLTINQAVTENILNIVPPPSIPKTWHLSQLIMNIYDNLLEVALKDGRLTEQEYNLLSNIMVNLKSYAKTYEDALIKDGFITGDEKEKIIKSSNKILEEAFSTAFIDKEIDVDEEKIILQLGKMLKELEIDVIENIS
jgi:DNA-binding PadR family transcriptional regulator